MEANSLNGAGTVVCVRASGSFCGWRPERPKLGCHRTNDSITVPLMNRERERERERERGVEGWVVLI